MNHKLWKVKSEKWKAKSEKCNQSNGKVAISVSCWLLQVLSDSFKGFPQLTGQASRSTQAFSSRSRCSRVSHRVSPVGHSTMHYSLEWHIMAISGHDIISTSHGAHRHLLSNCLVCKPKHRQDYRHDCRQNSSFSCLFLIRSGQAVGWSLINEEINQRLKFIIICAY